MHHKRIQNKVAESGLTLPVFSLFALCVLRPWQFAEAPFTAIHLVPLLLSCYVLMEWCNRQQIIRMRSRLTTSLYIWGVSIIDALLPCVDFVSHVVALGTVCCMFAVTSTYSCREPVVKVLHASFTLSAVSVLCPQLLFLWPVLLLCLAAYMRVFSLRVFSSSVMGVLLPWLFVAAWLFCDGYFDDGFEMGSLEIPSIPHSPLLIPYLVVSLLSLVSLLHFMRHSYDDKIKVRMIVYSIIVFWIALQLIIIVFPSTASALLPSLWLVGSPLVAHHLALSPSRWTTLWFAVTMLVLMGGSVYCFYE